jgi:hypothetical protein
MQPKILHHHRLSANRRSDEMRRHILHTRETVQSRTIIRNQRIVAAEVLELTTRPASGFLRHSG